MSKRTLPQTFTCEGCHQVITLAPEPAYDVRTQYCSRACKMRVWWRTHEKKKYPSSVAVMRRKEAVREAHASARVIRKVKQERKADEARRQQSFANAQRVCRICHVMFLKPLFRPGRWDLCPSLECRQKAKQASMRRSREIHGTKPAERARRRGLPYERCGAIAVCTRDGWRCQLCGTATPRRLRGTYDKRAPEVDHIIPLANPNSPGHVWSNVQCACRQCNLAKSSEIRGQFRLAI